MIEHNRILPLALKIIGMTFLLCCNVWTEDLVMKCYEEIFHFECSENTTINVTDPYFGYMTNPQCPKNEKCCAKETDCLFPVMKNTSFLRSINGCNGKRTCKVAVEWHILPFKCKKHINGSDLNVLVSNYVQLTLSCDTAKMIETEEDSSQKTTDNGKSEVGLYIGVAVAITVVCLSAVAIMVWIKRRKANAREGVLISNGVKRTTNSDKGKRENVSVQPDTTDDNNPVNVYSEMDEMAIKHHNEKAAPNHALYTGINNKTEELSIDHVNMTENNYYESSAVNKIDKQCFTNINSEVLTDNNYYESSEVSKTDVNLETNNDVLTENNYYDSSATTNPGIENHGKHTGGKADYDTPCMADENGKEAESGLVHDSFNIIDEPNKKKAENYVYQHFAPEGREREPNKGIENKPNY